MDKELERLRNKINSESIEDFDNLCASDMKNLLYTPFSEDSPLQYRQDIPEEILDDIGFFNLCEFLLHRLSRDKEITLTTRNNLNTKIVTEIYKRKFTSERVMELKPRTIYRELDLASLQIAMLIMCELMGLMKKRKNKLSLTKKGQKFITELCRTEQLRLIFECYVHKFNWSYHDGYPEAPRIQSSIGYLLFLLLSHGTEERPYQFYADKMIRAFPQLLRSFTATYTTPEKQFSSCLEIRCFNRFLKWFDFVDMGHKGERDYSKPLFIKMNHLEKFIYLEPSNFLYSKSKFEA